MARRKTEPEYVTISGEIQRTTAKAVLVAVEDGSEYWIPRSCIEGGDEIDATDTDLHVAKWFCEKEGLC